MDRATRRRQQRKDRKMKHIEFNSANLEDRNAFSDLYEWFKSANESVSGLTDLRLVSRILKKFRLLGAVREVTLSEDLMVQVAVLARAGCRVELPVDCHLPETETRTTVFLDLEETEFTRFYEVLSKVPFRMFGVERACYALELVESAKKCKDL